MRFSTQAALLFLLSPRVNQAQNLQDYLDAVRSIPPGDVNDPLKSGAQVPGLSESLYFSMIGSESCPAYQDDIQYTLDSLLMLDQGYPKFFEPRAFPNGAVFGPGRCTTTFIGQEQIRKKLENAPQLFEDDEIYRENSLRLLRLNDIVFKKGVWSDGYVGIVLGIPKEDHDIVRPVVDYLFGDSQEGTPLTFDNSGRTWDSTYFFESAQNYLSEKNEVTFNDDARAWVIKTFHEQIFGVSLSTEELQLFNILQSVFVLISSINPNAIELLYPVLDNLLIALAQAYFPIAIGELSGRLSEMMTRLDDATAEVDNMDVSETIASLENAMLEMQQLMSNIGGIGELNIAEELVPILFKLLNATKDAYATLYYIAIRYGQGPGGGGPGRRASLNSDTLKYVRDDLLEGDPESILKAGHAVADVFFFAGGLSVPDIITATAGVYFGNAIENVENVDIDNDMSLKLLVLEATRRFPPVLFFTYLERGTGQRIAPLPGMAGFDRNVYGEDVEKIKIRGDLAYYHRNSMNFAEPAGPLDGKPETSRMCPGRSMSIAMATQFIRAMQLGDYCLKPGESVVFDEGGPTFFNEFTVTKTCPSDEPSGEPSNEPSDLPSSKPSALPSNEPSDEPSDTPSLSITPTLAPSLSSAPSCLPSLSPNYLAKATKKTKNSKCV